MKMISTWFKSQRGLAVGTVVGALTVGKAGPYLVHAIPGAGVTPVVLSATVAALLSSVIVALAYVDGEPTPGARQAPGVGGATPGARSRAAEP